MDLGGDLVVGTLENGGIGLAPYHELEDLVSPELQAERDAPRAAITEGIVETMPG